jgi:hypothetical protein
LGRVRDAASALGVRARDPDDLEARVPPKALEVDRAAK